MPCYAQSCWDTSGKFFVVCIYYGTLATIHITATKQCVVSYSSCSQCIPSNAQSSGRAKITENLCLFAEQFHSNTFLNHIGKRYICCDATLNITNSTDCTSNFFFCIIYSHGTPPMLFPLRRAAFHLGNLRLLLLLGQCQ